MRMLCMLCTSSLMPMGMHHGVSSASIPVGDGGQNTMLMHSMMVSIKGVPKWVPFMPSFMTINGEKRGQ